MKVRRHRFLEKMCVFVGYLTYECVSVSESVSQPMKESCQEWMNSTSMESEDLLFKQILV
jgi:hypothetical protein